MKKTILLKHLSYLFFVVLLASCSTGHYAHLNKIQRDAVINDQAVKEIAKESNENSAINNTVTPEPAAIENCNDTGNSAAITAAKAATVKQNKTKSNFVSNMVANRIIKKLPNKLNAAFAEKQNIAKQSNMSDKGGNLLYIIIVALVILFLLGLLGGGGGLGSLIYIVLVIAVVLLLLRLLGIL